MIRRVVQALTRRTAPLWQSAPAGDPVQAAKAFREEMRELPLAAAGSEWSDYCAALKADARARDPSEFLQWPVVAATMNAQGSYIDLEFDYLRSGANWRQARHALSETRFGGAMPYWRHPWTSSNTIHHCYHLTRFANETGLTVNDFAAVLEFGGGYGNLCRVARRLGFSGEYAITDLAQFQTLQRMYLSATATKATLLTPKAVDSWLARHGAGDALFIATWSLSEAPLADRAITAELPRFKAALIAFQRSFEGVDNVSFFGDLKAQLEPTHNCTVTEIEHLQGNFYIFAWRR